MKHASLKSIIFFLSSAFSAMFFASLMSGCAAPKQIVSIRPNEHMEIGWTPRTIFQSPAYPWFDSAYTAYAPDHELTERLSTMKDSVDILVVYGTWCSDSKREIPHLLKITDAIHFPPERISLIAIDRGKLLPPGIASEYEITLVPTIIVRYRGLEVGRVIEAPRTSLEGDLVSMLSPLFQ